MQSRTEKYSKEFKQQSRVERNKELYNKIKPDEIDDYKIDSNVSILNVNGDNINIDKLRKVLDHKYRDTSQKHTIDIHLDEEKEVIETPTKEYDISSILTKAKAEKEVNYEEERLKKVRDTQFDILKDIKVEEQEEEKAKENLSVEEELITLINTITHKEDVSQTLIEEKFEELIGEDEEELLNNSFYTGKLSVSDKDYDDFVELSKEINSNSIIVKILLVIVFIIVVAVIVFFLDKTFAWGIF